MEATALLGETQTRIIDQGTATGFCDTYPKGLPAVPCDQQAQIIKKALAAIGLRVEVKAFPMGTYFTKLTTRGERFDIAWQGWLPDYQDPAARLNVLLETSTATPSFEDATYRAKLDAAAWLSGAQRYLTYARQDAELARTPYFS